MATNQANLYQRMLQVSTEVMNVEKNMKVGTGYNSYSAVADYDVVVAVKKAEAKHGVISIPVNQEIVESKVIETISVNNNGQETKKYQYVDIVKMTVRFINVDNPSESIEVTSYGRGIDTADKGFGKASTYARKYCLLNAYKIATGEDPDKDASPVYETPAPPPAQPAPQPQAPAPAPAPAKKKIVKGNANWKNAIEYACGRLKDKNGKIVDGNLDVDARLTVIKDRYDIDDATFADLEFSLDLNTK